MMQLVPFNRSWAESGSKLDLHAVYQRGDVIAPSLPVRRHHDHEAKGWRYITLSDGENINKVADGLRAAGISMNDLAKSYLRTGLRPFDVAQYLAETPQRDVDESAALKARLAQIEGSKKARATA